MTDVGNGENFVKIPAFEELNDNKDDHIDELRVEERITAYWDGVSGCCNGGRPQRNLDRKFSAWVDEKKAAHADRVFGGSGHGGGSAYCSQSGGGGTARSCRGNVSVEAFVIFY